jgi:hypothetical protein
LLLGQTVELGKLSKRWGIVRIEAIRHHRVVIQHPTTTIFEKLLMFLQAKDFRHCLIHFLGILKKLFLGLCKVRRDFLLLPLQVIPLLVGMEAPFTHLASTSAGRALLTIRIRTHNATLATNKAIITRG